MPSMPGSTMSISTASNAPCAIRSGAASPLADELGLMAEFGQDRVEHDAAERIVLDAEQAQRPRRIRRRVAIGAGRAPSRVLGRRQHDVSVKVVPPPRRCVDDDVAAHGARQLLDRRQSEPGAAEARGDGDIGLRERPEQPLDLGEREADAAVGDREGDADLALRRCAAASPCSATLPCSVNFTALSIRFSSAARRRTGSPTTNAGSFSEISTDDCRPLAAARPASESPALRASVRRSNKSCRTLEPGAAASRGIDEQGRKARQMFGAGLDGVDPAPLALVEIGGREQIADRENAGQRRADLMRKGGQRGLDHAGRGGRGLARLRARLRGGAGYALFRRPLFAGRVMRRERDFAAMIPLIPAAASMARRRAAEVTADVFSNPQ